MRKIRKNGVVGKVKNVRATQEKITRRSAKLQNTLPRTEKLWSDPAGPRRTQFTHICTQKHTQNPQNTLIPPPSEQR